MEANNIPIMGISPIVEDRTVNTEFNILPMVDDNGMGVNILLTFLISVAYEITPIFK